MSDSTEHTIRLPRGQSLSFSGRLLAAAEALNHDDSVRRRFRVYAADPAFVAERVDDPGTIDVRHWGARCADEQALYDFFGNEPLANYLYGTLGIDVPGLRSEQVSSH